MTGPGELAAQLLVDYVADALAAQLPGQGVYDVTAGGLTIGRLPQCELQINLPGVSRRHARIEVEGGRCYVSDLHSTNGTFVNSVPVAAQERRCLTNGDFVQIGTALVLRFVDTTRTTPDTTAHPYLP